MSLLLEAEKLNRKLQKLDAQYAEQANALIEKFRLKRLALLEAASPQVLALAQSAEHIEAEKSEATQ